MTVAARVALVGAIAAAAAGCASVPACPAKGGPAWRELTTAHFRLRTDLDAADAAEAIRSFEETRAAMLAVVWPRAPEPLGRTEVIALRSHEEFVAYLQDETVYGVHLRSPPFSPVIVTGGDLRGPERLTVSHELAHDLSLWFLPTQPLWYSEGIATFLETLRYDRTAQRAYAGEPSPLRVRGLYLEGRMHADPLLGERRASAVDAKFEDSAWLLFHYLMDNHPRQLGELQARLGLLDPPDHAWRAVFPDLPPDRLDFELTRYRALAQYQGGVLSLAIPPPAIHERTLADAEVHATRAFLYRAAIGPRATAQKEAAQSEIREALAEDAANTEALAIEYFWLTSADRKADRSTWARLASARHTESWLAWLMVADAAEDDAARRTALAKAVALGPDVPELLARLATLDYEQGRWQEGVPLSLKAMRLGVRQPAFILAHMQGLAHVGRCRDAELLSELLASGVGPAEAGKVREAWSALKSGCLEDPAPKPGTSGAKPGDGAE